MEHAIRTEPSLLRRCVADVLALGVGAGVSWFGVKWIVWLLGRFGDLDLALAATVCGCGAFVGVAARDGLLRRWGALLPPPRTPRGLRGILAWAGGYLAAAASVGSIWLLGRALGAGPSEAFRMVGLIALLTAPTVGILATRALCRRWATPPAVQPPASAAAPTPAPAPLPARPADDSPALPFLPSPA